jgi:hypothetical protein
MEGVSLALSQLQCIQSPPQPSPHTLPSSPDTAQGPVPTSPLPSSNSEEQESSNSEEQEIWVHLGVNSQQNGFRLEKVAWNGTTIFSFFSLLFPFPLPLFLLFSFSFLFFFFPRRTHIRFPITT